MLRAIAVTTLFLTAFQFRIEATEVKDTEVTLRAKLKQLVELRIKVINANDDATRNAANKEFLHFLRDAMNDPKSFKTAFDTIPQFTDLRSSDNFLRMLNWNVPQDDQTHRYFCFIQFFDRKTKAYKVVELKQGYRSVKGEERKVFSDGDWYGALYYYIIPAKRTFRHRKKTYMLLGWDGHNAYSTIKLVDVMTVTNSTVRFGAEMFELPDKSAARLVLEYKADAYVSLKYVPDEKQIVFNKLVPMQPDLEGMPEFYIPLLEFDALRWKSGKWRYVPDVDMRHEEVKRTYNDPPLPQKTRK